MKKILIITLMALLLILTVYTMVSGISIGPVEIPGIMGIVQKNDELDAKIAQANKLADTEYKRKLNTLTTNTKKLEDEKTKYQDLAAVSLESGNGTTGQVEKYEIEYLWTRVGNHATSEGVDVDMDVQTVEAAQGIYNLDFTVTGTYIGIQEFISAIENDSSLGFKIEQFSLTGSGDIITGKFICKNIMIKDVESVAVKSEDEEGEDTKDNTNTTNSTKNNTTNTTNSTGTDNIIDSVKDSQTNSTNTNR